MSTSVRVHLLPVLFEPKDVVGGVAVIVDVLRASTTITHALANGAAAVIPCGTIEAAMALRTPSAHESLLLGGERGGVKIEGFDLSNSPDDYHASVVAGKSIGFTTTNGTKALLRSRQADESVIGAFVNLSAIVDYLRTQDRSIHLVCAGTNGAISGEDVLFAGAVVDRLLQNESRFEVCDAARIARSHWVDQVNDVTSLESAIRRSQGGRNLIQLGYDKDIVTAAAMDSVPVLGISGPDGITRM